MYTLYDNKNEPINRVRVRDTSRAFPIRGKFKKKS